MQTKERSTVFSGDVVNVEQMDVLVPKVGWHTYQIVHHPGQAAALPLHEDGTVTLIRRQISPAVGNVLIELPGACLSPGEDPELCVSRGLTRDTGIIASLFSSLGLLHPSPGVSDEVIHLYLATGLSQWEVGSDVSEETVLIRMPLDEALTMAVEGGITDAKTIAALMRAVRRLK